MFTYQSVQAFDTDLVAGKLTVDISIGMVGGAYYFIGRLTGDSNMLFKVLP
jgi:hypothetical protein